MSRQSPPRQSDGLPPSFSPPPKSRIALLVRNDVAAELHLTESQKQEITASIEKALEPPRGGMPGGGFPGGGMPGGGMPGGGMPGGGGFPGGGFPGGGMPGGGEMPSMESIQKMIQSKVDGAAKNAIKKLKPEQAERFQQIYLQTRGYLAVAEKETRKRLKTTKDQNRDLVRIEKAQESAFAAIRPPEGQNRPSPMEVKRQLEQVEKNLGAEIEALLSAEQKETFRSMQGPEFKPNPELGSFFSFKPPSDRN